jgi:hypothetical protein
MTEKSRLASGLGSGLLRRKVFPQGADLPSDLTPREVTGSRVGGIDAVIGMDVHVGPPVLHRRHQHAQALTRQRAHQVRGSRQGFFTGTPRARATLTALEGTLYPPRHG